MHARHRLLIDRIESLIHRDVGRGMQAVFRATEGGLWAGTYALAAETSPRIGFITGFFVPGGDPPAAETDGPAGAALLARGFVEAGLPCRLATDIECRSASRAALDQAGASGVPIDAMAPGDTTDALIARWRQEGINWVIAIERCGPGEDGRLRNMRGTDISTHAAPLDRLFSAGPWRTVAIGDGGNEIGMGVVPRPLIAEHIALGQVIGCVVPADHLITAGVSHWGAYGVLAALAVLRPEWSMAMLGSLDPALDRAVIEAMVRKGPAVDGVSLRRATTIDGLEMDLHHEVLHMIRANIRTIDGGNHQQPPTAPSAETLGTHELADPGLHSKDSVQRPPNE